jgi:ribosomal protein S18 acetylase RimI-like enzyme
MLEFVEDLCRQRKIKKIWLTVNKNNSHSIKWYSRMGFTNTGPLLQDIGGGFVMNDYRMEKTIG